jgi:hypothetical protein
LAAVFFFGAAAFFVVFFAVFFFAAMQSLRWFLPSPNGGGALHSDTVTECLT